MASRVTPITQARSFVARREPRSGRIAVLLLLPVAILLIIGLGALLSASSVLAIREGYDDNLYYFKRQLVFAGLGVICLIIGARIPYRWYQRAAMPIFGLAIVGLVATLVIGQVRGGAQRWIELGPVTIQASEFAKFAAVVVLAMVLARKQGYLDTFGHVIAPVAAVLIFLGAPLMKQPDFGTTALIAATAIAVLVASTAKLRHVIGVTLTGAAFGGLLAVAAPYRLERVTSFFSANPDVLGDGYHAHQSLVALGTGGWFGVGLGASRARWCSTSSASWPPCAWPPPAARTRTSTPAWTPRPGSRPWPWLSRSC